MKTVFALIALVLSTPAAHAASRMQKFTIANPGVHCEVGTASRSAGVRYISVVGDINQILASATTSTGTPIATRITGEPITFDYTPSCQKLAPIPSVLEGTRELWVQRLESQGKCSTIVIEEIIIDIGQGNPKPQAKTAWPILGNDLSEYSEANCQLTETEFEIAIDQAF